MTYRKLFGYMLLLITCVGLLSGCFSKSQPENTQTSSVTGIIDMDKAIKAHPKWNQLQELNQKLNTLIAQQQQIEQQSTQQVLPPPLPDASKDTAAEPQNQSGLDTFLAQERDAKLSKKQAELEAALNEKTAGLRQNAANEFQAYAAELEKQYEPQIFSLQLKMKTVQMSQSEMAGVQQEIDKIQTEQQSKLQTKQQDLNRQLEAAIAPTRAELEKQLSLYAQQIQSESDAKRAQKLAEQQSMAQQLAMLQTQSNIPPDVTPSTVSYEQEIQVVKQQIAVLEDIIIADIKDKASRIAGQEGISLVLANVDVNVSARDITNEVIAEFKK